MAAKTMKGGKGMAPMSGPKAPSGGMPSQDSSRGPAGRNAKPSKGSSAKSSMMWGIGGKPA